MKKRIFALLLALAVIVSIFPANVFAEESGEETGTQCNCPEGHDTASGHVATCPLYACPDCGKSDCYDGSCKQTPDYSGDVGKFAKLNEAASNFRVFNKDTGHTFTYIPDDFQSGTILRIADWMTNENGLWYQVEFYKGGTQGDYTLDFPAEPWFQQTTAGELVFVDPCSVCGEPCCNTTHTWCETCKIYDCGKDHTLPENPCSCCESCTGAEGCTCECENCTFKTETPTEKPTEPEDTCDCCGGCSGVKGCICQCGECDFCVKEENPTTPETPTVPNVSGTVNGQTITVSGTLPQDVTLKVDPADVSQQLAQFDVSADKLVFGLDISLRRNGEDYQPESTVRVKVPVTAAPGTTIGLLRTHDGITSFIGITEVLSDGTVEFTTDRFSDWAGFVVDLSNTTVNFHIYLPGTWKQVSLAAALEANGHPAEIAAAVANVKCSDEETLHAEKSNGDWLLQAKEVFYDERIFTLTFTDGTTVELKAVGKPVYSVSFDCQGQTTGSPTIYFVPSEHAYYLDQYCQNPIADNKMLIPTKTGHVFEGFYAQPKNDAPPGTQYIDENGYIQSACCEIGSSTTLYAHWQGTFTITYNLNYPNPPEFGPDTYTYDTPVVLPVPEREGYIFTYWKKETVDGNNWGSTWYKPTESPGIYSYGDVILSARWEAIKYTATFDANGGTVDSGSKTYTIESALELPTPTRKGYTFKGWLLETGLTSPNGNWNAATYNADSVGAGKYGNVTFVAQWEIVHYTITYNLNGGTVDGTNPTTYTIEDTFTLINPTKEGYDFVGWTGTGLSGATQTVEVAKGSTGNRNYTATWTENKATITYVVDGNVGGTVKVGEDGTAGASVSQEINVVTGTANAVSAIPAPGYHFVEWYDKNGNKIAEDLSWTPSKPNTGMWEDVTYTAKFEINTISLTIETSNGTDADQNNIFIVTGKSLDEETTINLKIVLKANDRKTIVGLPAGDYSITNQQGWSWRYGTWSWNNGGNPVLETPQQSVQYSGGTVTNPYWLNGYGYKQINTGNGGNG